MNDEIKVGEYIRNKGFIAKVVYKDDDCIECDNFININTLSYEESIFIFKHDLECEIKHSPNIIDLVEVGDYIKLYDGSLVEAVEITKDHIVITTYRDTCYATREDFEIKGIVTKEQFEKIMYRVEE